MENTFKFAVGDKVYVTAGYWAGHYGTVAARYMERSAYSVFVNNERNALIAESDLVKA